MDHFTLGVVWLDVLFAAHKTSTR